MHTDHIIKHETDSAFDPCFFPYSDDIGIFVSDIIRGSVTDLDGRLLLGDQILSINGEDVRAAAQEHAQRLLQVRRIHGHACKLKFGPFLLLFGRELTYVCAFFALKNCSGEVYLEVARFKAGPQYSQQSQVNELVTDDSEHICTAEIVLILQQLFFHFHM